MRLWDICGTHGNTKHKRTTKMRTKTLLLGVAAALAVGLTASQAQTVYSQNVVGYINVTVPGSGFAEVANQLINGSDVNQSNNDINVVFGTGLISDQQVPGNGSNAVFLAWNNVLGSFQKYYYYNQSDASNAYNNVNINGSTPGWYDIGGNNVSASYPPGTSGFLNDVSASPMTVTMVGTVVQGTNTVGAGPVPVVGFAFLSLPQPISTNVDVAGYGLPGSLLTSDNNVPGNGTNDVLLTWNGSSYIKFYYYNSSDANIAYNNVNINASTPGFYDIGGNPMGPPLTAFPTAGQGFVLEHTGTPFTWTNIFLVQ